MEKTIISNGVNLRTCRSCCHYPNCPEWNDDDICNEHLTDEEAGLNEDNQDVQM